MKFCKGNLIVARAWKENTLYAMHARLCRNEVNVAASELEGYVEASQKRTPAGGE